mmetsp:Transcript_12320/g.23929  ORF Transcript_12320/g.23929 Transcript_12320/m.23929 type:complete len:105 (-) Transcript_12320:97-411(-)
MERSHSKTLIQDAKEGSMVARVAILHMPMLHAMAPSRDVPLQLKTVASGLWALKTVTLTLAESTTTAFARVRTTRMLVLAKTPSSRSCNLLLSDVNGIAPLKKA